ncbi:PREDICTED: putative disease resistance protein RGA1 isoform X2 [Erythranthe guttata]|uniref:putative disease resistance protein RGA1 isoform X2 n=1 Tax=Erythranthe guttata TaxID=4155 RepID=UPI00064DA869|nr:PREDICTED: putative disease resistance protein RGA1 isoform X2 [Erythranthe guttata]|eukprot:XP_012856717.1 PREDICTED: putative disease resistance protein RGA1 isoform X2 [Erythranthe guttata]
MADAIVSVVVERIAATLKEQMRNGVNLVSGVESEILKLSDDLNTLRHVLHDAEKKGYKDIIVKKWLTRLEETAYEMDDVLDVWNIAILEHSKHKVHSYIVSSYLYFMKVVVRREIASKIEQVKARFDIILEEKDRYGFAVASQPSDPSHSEVQSTSLIELDEVCGRDLERENLVRKLVGEELGLQVVSIVGVGGLGKTTLAKLAYNDSRVKNCFELRIWICVSNSFDEVGIASAIIEGARGRKAYPNQLELVLDRLKEVVSRRKFLIILDDVWTKDGTMWEPVKICLRIGGAGSKVLVTTRNEGVASIMGGFENEIRRLGHLSHEECWLLLRRIALCGNDEKEREKFEKIGKEIANKCKGLPLAVKILGGLLRFKNTVEEWESVLNSEIWELEEAEVELFPYLLLSYNELSPALKRCFSYCGVFPKDTRIDVEKLITEWMALGYLGSKAGDWEVRGREYFDILAARCLFQNFDKGYSFQDLDKDYSCEHIKSFKMHDMLHDFARFLRKNVGSRIKRTTCRECGPVLVSQVRVYHSLFHRKHPLLDADPHFCDGFTSLRLLSLRDCCLRGIPKQVEKLIHLRSLDLGCNKFLDERDLKGICKLYNLRFLWLDGCRLKEIPSEIRDLIHMIHLDLSNNEFVELPDSLCDMLELESLNVYNCISLVRLPQGMHRLVNLRHLCNFGTDRLEQYPQGVAELTRLVTLKQFHVQDGSKLGWLKKLNRLGGQVELRIVASIGDSKEAMAAVEDAREAELGKKTRIQDLGINFCGSRIDGEEVNESVWVDILDALEPHPNTQKLSMCYYDGSLLPRWIVSPLNQVMSIRLSRCPSLLWLPPLGKLPLLENLEISKFFKLEFVGREFLGTTTTTTTRSGFFPKLKKLMIWQCPKWKEWEDITVEEDEDFGDVPIMPCLRKLEILGCSGLAELPVRLLKKAASLKVMNIWGSMQLLQLYGDENGQPWKSISSHNPHLHLLKDGTHYLPD